MPFKKLFKKKGKQACVIGLDGVPCSLLHDMMERGVMPRTREITAQGRIRDMTVTLPEISSVSWSTFMTGKNPGEHGIFGFTDLKRDSYSLRFPSFRDLQSETIWDRMGERGMRSIVVNQPSTYPAREIPGVLISGFVAIDLDRAIWPRKYLATLASTRYRIDVDTEKCAGDANKLFDELDMLLECRRQIVDELWNKEPWNLLQVVVTGTDRLHHFMWDAYEDPSHEHHERFLGYYRHVDEFVGQMYEKFTNESDEENFFLLSDHGFCGTRHEVYVNAVLEQHGFLSVEGDRGLAGITPKSKAFALDPARIYIHRRSKYPNGEVDESDVSTIKNELKSIFQTVEHDGADGRQGVVRKVFDGKDVYSGPYAEQGPDLLLIPKNGYDMKGKVGADTIIGDRRLQGMHTWDDAFFFSRRADLLSDNEPLTIVDVPWKILRSLDVE